MIFSAFTKTEVFAAFETFTANFARTLRQHNLARALLCLRRLEAKLFQRYLACLVRLQGSNRRPCQRSDDVHVRMNLRRVHAKLRRANVGVPAGVRGLVLRERDAHGHVAFMVQQLILCNVCGIAQISWHPCCSAGIASPRPDRAIDPPVRARPPSHRSSGSADSPNRRTRSRSHRSRAACPPPPLAELLACAAATSGISAISSPR